MRLSPILTEQYKRVLKEAEKRLGSRVENSSTPTNRLKKINTRLSKKELKEKFSRMF